MKSVRLYIQTVGGIKSISHRRLAGLHSKVSGEQHLTSADRKLLAQVIENALAGPLVLSFLTDDELTAILHSIVRRLIKSNSQFRDAVFAETEPVQ